MEIQSFRSKLKLSLFALIPAVGFHLIAWHRRLQRQTPSHLLNQKLTTLPCIGEGGWSGEAGREGRRK
jgi:hypothetical protein